jgi:hypothetical protein
VAAVVVAVVVATVVAAVVAAVAAVAAAAAVGHDGDASHLPFQHSNRREEEGKKHVAASEQD